jgi:hypothetical protein
MEENREIINFFENSECSFNQMGDYLLLQPAYRCERCGETEVCIGCINTCHLKCFKGEVPSHVTDSSRFNCECGKENDHKIVRVDEKIIITSCNLKAFNRYVNIPKNYFCMEHQCSICSICKVEYHSSCRGFRILDVEKENVGNKNSSSLQCQCISFNHTTHFNFILEAAFPSNLPIGEYSHSL